MRSGGRTKEPPWRITLTLLSVSNLRFFFFFFFRSSILILIFFSNHDWNFPPPKATTFLSFPPLPSPSPSHSPSRPIQNNPSKPPPPPPPLKTTPPKPPPQPPQPSTPPSSTTSAPPSHTRPQPRTRPYGAHTTSSLRLERRLWVRIGGYSCRLLRCRGGGRCC